MSSKIPFEFDISVSADKKRRAKNKGSSGAFEGSSHKCDVVGCELIGKYRAPKSPKNVEEFNWFCLKHVKEYNKKWNYFEGHSQEELENQFKADSVWERKTTPLNSDAQKDKIQAEGKAWERLGLEDPYKLFSNKENQKAKLSVQHNITLKLLRQHNTPKTRTARQKLHNLALQNLKLRKHHKRDVATMGLSHLPDVGNCGKAG